MIGFRIFGRAFSRRRVITATKRTLASMALGLVILVVWLWLVTPEADMASGLMGVWL